MARQRCFQSPTLGLGLGIGIATEAIWTIFELDEVVRGIADNGQELSEIIEGFSWFQESILSDCDAHRSNEWLVLITAALWLSFPPFLHCIAIFERENDFFLRNEVMTRLYCSPCFRIGTAGVDSDVFLKLYDPGGHFDSLLELQILIESGDRGSDSLFVLTEQDGEENDEFLSTDASDFRGILQLSGGSRCACGSTFFRNVSATSIEICSCVSDIDGYPFRDITSLTQILFESQSHVKRINGFHRCTSLCRIDLPSSVESIGMDGFFACASLNEVVFLSDSYVRQIDGFQHCCSIC
jgi:hypothetical protein